MGIMFLRHLNWDYQLSLSLSLHNWNNDNNYIHCVEDLVLFTKSSISPFTSLLCDGIFNEALPTLLHLRSALDTAAFPFPFPFVCLATKALPHQRRFSYGLPLLLLLLLFFNYLRFVCYLDYTFCVQNS